MESKTKLNKLDHRTDEVYVKWPGKSEQDFIYEICQLGYLTHHKKYLGDNQFYYTRRFTKRQGWMILEKIISENRMDILESSKIYTSSGKEWTVEKFLTSLENVEIK